jgi:hypothetical protein
MRKVGAPTELMRVDGAVSIIMLPSCHVGSQHAEAIVTVSDPA